MIVTMARLQLRLFGSFQVEIDGRPASNFRSDKVRALLAYLAMEPGRAHRRESLAVRFWPASDDSAARASLRMALSNLRQVLEPVLDEDNKLPLLEVTRHSAQLHRDNPDCRLDVARFDAWLDACDTHPHQDLTHCLVCIPRLAQAVALYTGDFLAGLTLADAPSFDEWRLVLQEKYHQRALAALQTLAQHHLAGGDTAQAQEYARQQLSLAPWNEEAHRQLMQALALAGQPGEALTQYDACRRVLAEELGVEPTTETVALAGQIEAGELEQLETIGQQSTVPARMTHNLPPQTTPFIGRRTELMEVRRLLLDPAYRLVTLVGAGGVGKTRLALALAGQMQPYFPEGVWFVPLVGVERPNPETDDLAAAIEVALATAIAGALDFTFQGEASLQTQLLRYLRDKELLLVLDNFEHLLEGVGFLTEILGHATTVTLLVTSRERLNLQAEYSYHLPGLVLETDGEADTAVQSESVQLFVERAGRAPAGFTLTKANWPHVVEICRLVDGLPLGIELAATWTSQYTVAEIARAMKDNLGFLTTQRQDVPDRHRSLQAVFEQSWRLLGGREQAVLAVAAVFQGQFTREAAVTVIETPLLALASLVDKSLLRRSVDGWYELHPLLRQFAGHKQEQFATEMAQARPRYIRHYLYLVMEQEAKLDTTAAPAALRQLRRHLPNIRQAWEWAVDSHNLSLLNDSLEPMAAFFIHAGLLQEGAQRLDTALAQLATTGAGDAELHRVVRARMMNQRARFAYILTDYDGGLTIAQSALELAVKAGLDTVIAHSRLEIGRALEGRCEYEAAQVQLEQALQLAEAEKQPFVHINSLRTLGHVLMFQGDYDAARRHYKAGLDAAREYGRHTSEIHMRINLGNIAYLEGDFTTSRRQFEQAIEMARQMGNRRVESTALGNLGRIFLDQGEYTAARRAIEESIAYKADMGDSYGVAILRNSLGDIALNQGDYEQARTLFRQCVAAHQEAGNRQATAHALANVALAMHLLDEHEAAAALCRESLALSREVGSAVEQGDALTRLGQALAALGQEDEAISTYEEALALRRELGQTNRALEPLAGLARLALAQERVEEALVYVDEIWDFLQDNNLTGVVQPFLVYLTCYEVLQANADERATAVLKDAYQLLHDQAARIDDEAARQAFLENVAAHRQIAMYNTRYDSFSQRNHSKN